MKGKVSFTLFMLPTWIGDAPQPALSRITSVPPFFQLCLPVAAPVVIHRACCMEYIAAD